MYEFNLINIYTNEMKYAFGYNYKDACKRFNLNPAEWIIDWQEYVD